MTEEVKYMTFDGQDYIITDEIMINNVKYVYFTNEHDVTNFFVKKVNMINGEEYLVALANDEEVNMALREYALKNKNVQD